MGFYPKNIANQIPNGSITSAQLASGVLTNVKNITYTGATDGINDTFTLGSTPASGTLVAYVGGQIKFETDDFTLTGTTVVFNAENKVLIDSSLKFRGQI